MASLPARIGRYEVLSLLGQGGMGVLYLARDPVIDRHVALKLLKVDNEDLRRRFVREARSAGRLQHPNIVTVYDVGDHDGELFIAMEYIDGDTLATLIRDDVPFSTLRKLELLDQLADGLGFAHQRDIVHRDIKPSNLMVTRGGLLKVLDFGIARLVRGQAALATMGAGLVGTPAYMAPEQLEGGEVDHRADIFAVGLVMYELLTGKRAFVGQTTAEVIQHVLQTEPVPLDQVLPSADPHLVRCVARALAKRPDDRYSNLQDLRNDLGRVRRRVELESGAFDATVVVQLPTSRRAESHAERPPPTAPLPSSPEPPPLPTAVPLRATPGTRVHDADAPTMVVPVMPVPAATVGRVLAPGEPVTIAAGTGPPSHAPVSRPLPTPPVAPPSLPPTEPAPSAQAGVTSPPVARRSMLPAVMVLGVVLVMLVLVVLGAWWWLRTALASRTQPSEAAASVEGTTGEIAEGTPDVMITPPAAPVAAPVTQPAADADVADAGANPPATAGGGESVDPPPAALTPPPVAPPAGPARRAPSRQAEVRAVPPPAPAVVATRETDVDSQAQAPVDPAPAPPADVVAPDEALAIVRAYVAARNTAHAAGMRRVWPTVTDTELRRITSEFSAPLTLTGCEVEGAGATMRAACGFTQPGTTAFSQGTPLTVRRRLVFDLARQGRGWVITAVTG